MITVIQYFWRLCMMQANPSQAPTATWFVAALLAVNVLVSVVLSTYINEDISALTVTSAILTQQAALAGLLWVALYLRELPQRFLATFTSWLGCDLVISVALALALPIFAQLNPENEAAKQVAVLPFFVWTIAAYANVARHAFNTSLGMGVMIALGLSVLATAISQLAINA